MPILLMDYSTLATAELYVDFISSLTWYRMYCVGKFGKSKKDYVDGFKQLKESYDALWQFIDTQMPEWHEKPAKKLVESIETILSRKNLTDGLIKNIADLLYKFENENEREFRTKFFDHLIEDSAKYQYGIKLYNAAGRFLDDGKYEVAVLNAFKYLDSFLQEQLGVSPHKYYGEDLINFAFAPNTGKLQLDTSANEQSGLRNLVSGANASFRNPSAHRFMNYDDFSASTIVALVRLVEILASRLNKK